jgi:hypothetical protein
MGQGILLSSAPGQLIIGGRVVAIGGTERVISELVKSVKGGEVLVKF